MFQAQATNDLIGCALIALGGINGLLFLIVRAAWRMEDRHRTMFRVYCASRQAVKEAADKQREVAMSVLRKQTPPRPAA